MPVTPIPGNGIEALIDDAGQLTLKCTSCNPPTMLTVTDSATNPPALNGIVVLKTWRIDANSIAALPQSKLEYPVPPGGSDANLRFYTADSLAQPVPIGWEPLPESPLGDNKVDGTIDWVPPRYVTKPPNTTRYLVLVRIP